MKWKSMAILLAFLLFMQASPLSAALSPTADSGSLDSNLSQDVVYNMEQLEQWITGHADCGGRVMLGNIITLTNFISLYSEGHIVIDAGPHGLVYDGGYIDLDSFEIVGEGVDVPVLDIQTVIQHGVYWELGWNDRVQKINVTATGRNGTGGVALRIRQNDGYFAHCDYYETEGLIRSYGTGAVGLYLDAPLDVYCLQIEVEGDNSIAVYAEQRADLYYCKLSARGEGAACVSGPGEVLLDVCAAVPVPQNAGVINRRITGLYGQELYQPVKQNDHEFYYDVFFNNSFVFFLSGEDGFPAVIQRFALMWAIGPRDIDVSVLGRLVIPCSLYPPYRGFGLEDDFPLAMIVDVRDPSVPCISSIHFREDEERGPYVVLWFWEFYDRDDESVILWRSDDGGKSWWDFTDSSDIEWHGNAISYYSGELPSPVMLQLEVLRKGESNVVTLHKFDGNLGGGIGGDRNGSGRIVISKPGNDNTPDSEDDPQHPDAFNGQDLSDHPDDSDGSNIPKGAIPSGTEDLQIEGGNDPLNPGRTADISTPDAQSAAALMEGPVSRDAGPDALPTGESADDPDPADVLPYPPLSQPDNRQQAGEPSVPGSPMSMVAALLILCASVTIGALAWKKGTLPDRVRAAQSAHGIGQNSLMSPAVCCALAVLCCMLLYRFDNKYTAPGPQALNGVLELNEDTQNEHPVLHLVHGWELYRALLTPEDFIEKPPTPDRYVFIGQYGGFELDDPDASPYGSATYRMNVFTGSDEIRNYMLELPEIFSAYRLWVNGVLLLENGKTGQSRAEYTPEITNGAVTFLAGNRIEILLAVSNYQHYYSGMVYPPAFGGVKAVSNLLKSRVVISAALCLLALLTGLFYLCIGVFGRGKKSAVCFGMLCFLYAGSVSHTLVHFLNAANPNFWYAFEDFCFYGTILSIICLQGLICEAPKHFYRAFIILGTVVCVASVVFPSFILGEDSRAMNAYSWFVTAYKAAAVGYLVIAAFTAVKRRVVYSKAILSGVCVFGVFLAMDAFVQPYEPVRFGWPTEIGGFVLVCVLGAVMTTETIRGLRERLTLASKNELLVAHSKHIELQLAMQAEQYRSLTGHMAEAKQTRHDMHHQLTVLRDYAASGDLDGLGRYIDEYIEGIPRDTEIPFCENYAVGAVARHYCTLAHSEGIQTDVSLEIPEKVGFIADPDLCILIGNLLENALEACRRMQQGERFIRIRSIIKGGYLSISVTNSFDGFMVEKDGVYCSRKRKGEGVGIPSVRAIAEKYSGMTSFKAEGDRFIASIVVALKMEREAIHSSPLPL